MKRLPPYEHAGRFVLLALLAMGTMAADAAETRPALPGSHASATAEVSTPLTPERAQQAILSAVAALSPAHPPGRRYRQAFAYGSPLFPGDGELRGGPPSAALAHWLALPPAQRAHDLLIVPDVDHYWPQDGAAYSTRFVLHLAPDGRGGTSLTIFQYQPTILHGRSFKLLGRTGPGFYLDIRPAPPSAQAVADLRAWLNKVLDQAPR
jgi:hypothetical protein